MKIIVNLHALSLDLDDLPETPLMDPKLATEWVHDSIGWLLACETNDSCEFYPVSDPKQQLIFGKECPDTFRSTAESWNAAIKSNFLRCLEKVSPDVAAGGVIVSDHLQVDNTDTYNLQVAAHMLNNSWTHDSLFGAVLEAATFSVTLSHDQMQAIMANPEQYVLLDIPIKRHF